MLWCHPKRKSFGAQSFTFLLNDCQSPKVLDWAARKCGLSGLTKPTFGSLSYSCPKDIFVTQGAFSNHSRENMQICRNLISSYKSLMSHRPVNIQSVPLSCLTPYENRIFSLPNILVNNNTAPILSTPPGAKIIEYASWEQLLWSKTLFSSSDPTSDCCLRIWIRQRHKQNVRAHFQHV